MTRVSKQFPREMKHSRESSVESLIVWQQVTMTKSRPIDILYVGESIIDCISHYQLCHKDTSLNLVYVSTEGTLTEGQMQLLRIIISKNEVKSLRTIFDNDKQGYKYTLWLDNNLRGMQHDVEQMDNEVLKKYSLPGSEY